jgi:DNA-binding XRE family transcriptional regulator
MPVSSIGHVPSVGNGRYPHDRQKHESGWSVFAAQHAVLFVFFLLVGVDPGSVGAHRDLPANYARLFRALGHRIRSYRTERQLSQEDMISYGFSVRHWQMIESGRPVTVFTLLRICEAFNLTLEQLCAGLSQHLRKRRGE